MFTVNVRVTYNMGVPQGSTRQQYNQFIDQNVHDSISSIQRLLPFSRLPSSVCSPSSVVQGTASCPTPAAVVFAVDASIPRRQHSWRISRVLWHDAASGRPFHDSERPEDSQIHGPASVCAHPSRSDTGFPTVQQILSTVVVFSHTEIIKKYFLLAECKATNDTYTPAKKLFYL